MGQDPPPQKGGRRTQELAKPSTVAGGSWVSIGGGLVTGCGGGLTLHLARGGQGCRSAAYSVWTAPPRRMTHPKHQQC